MGVPPAGVTTRVAVQSTRRLLRDTLSASLAARPDITVVGGVAEPPSIFQLCELRHPDVVILDAGLRLAEYASRVHALMTRFPDLNVIVTYREATEQELAAACRAGVTSLLPESHGLAAVLALVKRRKKAVVRAAEGGLTDRELEIVVLTGSGHSVAEIADLLGISPLTVENIKRRVYAKLEVSSSVHAAAKAASYGLLDQQRALPTARRRMAGLARAWRTSISPALLTIPSVTSRLAMGAPFSSNRRTSSVPVGSDSSSLAAPAVAPSANWRDSPPAACPPCAGASPAGPPPRATPEISIVLTPPSDGIANVWVSSRSPSTVTSA